MAATYLATDGRTTLTWAPATDTVPDGALVSAQFTGTTWHQMTQAGADWSILVAGPDAEGNPAGTVVLPEGMFSARVKVESGTEVRYYSGSTVVVYAPTPAMWPMIWPDPDPRQSATPEQVRVAEQFAAETMRMLTAYQVGGTPITVMPCGATCRTATTHGPAFWPVHTGYGQWRNTCGCAAGCGCEWAPTVLLDGPVGRVDEVVVNGVVLDPASYRVENGVRLVRTDGEGWPPCSGDTFTVTYLQGHAVSHTGAIAGGIMAAEYLKAVTGSKACKLPASVTSLTRAGVSMTITPGMFPDGRTGITEVDTYLGARNPYSLKVAPQVLSPDRSSQRTVSWRGSARVL